MDTFCKEGIVDLEGRLTRDNVWSPEFCIEGGRQDGQRGAIECLQSYKYKFLVYYIFHSHTSYVADGKIINPCVQIAYVEAVNKEDAMEIVNKKIPDSVALKAEPLPQHR